MVQGFENQRTDPITNGEVIDILRRLPRQNPFGLFDGEKPDFLRQIYLPLHRLFGRPSFSRTNFMKVQQITHLEVPNSISNQFPRWLEKPLDFWENFTDELPRYSQEEIEARARAFLQSAALLERQIDNQRIFRRFVAVSAYRLFRRATPTSSTRILNSNIERFLNLVGFQDSETGFETYGSIIRRGKRLADFCRAAEVGEDDGVTHGEINDFGPLFLLDLPDSIWESKGLLANDWTSAIQHLQTKNIQKVTQQSNAKRVASHLLNYHLSFIWTRNLDPGCHAVGKRGLRSQNNNTEQTSTTKRQRVENTANPRRFMHAHISSRHSQKSSGRAPWSQEMGLSPAQDISLQSHLPLNWQVLGMQPGDTSKFTFDITHNPSRESQGPQALVSDACSADTNFLVLGPEANPNEIRHSENEVSISHLSGLNYDLNHLEVPGSGSKEMHHEVSIENLLPLDPHFSGTSLAPNLFAAGRLNYSEL
ncbi:hypothetical protein CDD81_2840 [Ophiocordyceps australis]|uniref:Uncharacterized protein n=1 Tax=Ophiocordyceps australis TaxID=1399860 RepID=A0A2C5XXB4_9HYPO|nr:hypothetical protein CDD81_2840 [Ophiocordyceps australis]